MFGANGRKRILPLRIEKEGKGEVEKLASLKPANRSSPPLREVREGVAGYSSAISYAPAFNTPKTKQAFGTLAMKKELPPDYAARIFPEGGALGRTITGRRA